MKPAWIIPKAATGFLAAWLVLFLFAGSLPAAGWEAELVDQAGAASSTSLRIDKDGNVHVAYVAADGNRNPLKYAFWDRSLQKWFTMTVAEGAANPSLVLDSEQHPHISFADFGTMSGSRLRYAHWDGVEWKKVPIPLNSDIIAYFTSIVLGSGDTPSISFYEYRGPRESNFQIRLRNVSWNGEHWEVRTVDPVEGSGKFNCMAMDSQGHPHIAYANVSTGTSGMRYASWDGKSWNLEVLEGEAENRGGSVGYSACMVLDQDDIPHLTYSNVSDPAAKYAVRRDGEWHIETVDTLAGAGYPDRNAIALDDHGTPYIGYYDSGRGIPKVAHRTEEGWVAEVVDTNSSGFTPSMQVDRGVIWISYSDEANRGLKVARRELGSSEPVSATGETAVPVPEVAQTANTAKDQ